VPQFSGAGPDEARRGSNVRQAFLHLPFKAAWKIRHERELSRGIFELDFVPGSCGVPMRAEIELCGWCGPKKTLQNLELRLRPRSLAAS
jgi:hypothetical protein